ncbi:hypothetical protein KA005_13910 [bacterium]|nr:hypothetical protein [bacterium]
MICSAELPIKYLSYSKHLDFDFVIASTCLECPEYLEYFMSVKGNNPRFTILDNGAFETGEAIKDGEYIELARKLQPDVLVVPDVYKDNVATGNRAVNFFTAWQNNSVDGVELMGVLQGNSWDVLVAMYQILYAPICKYIGLPYATGIDRYQFLKAHPEIPNVHILGAPTLTEIYGLRCLPNVMSIDSSLPVKCAKDMKFIEEVLVSDSYAKPDEKDLDPLTLSYNLQMFTALCNGKTNIVPVMEDII